MDQDEEFLSIYNEYYPYERYIVREPKPINCLFDDALLIELFIPETEIKPITRNGKVVMFTEIPQDEIYVKIKGPAGEMRFGFFDFDSSVRETIRSIVINDFGDYEWESLYVDNEDGDKELQNTLDEQRRLIIERYGECNLKKQFKI